MDLSRLQLPSRRPSDGPRPERGMPSLWPSEVNVSYVTASDDSEDAPAPRSFPQVISQPISETSQPGAHPALPLTSATRNPLAPGPAPAHVEVVAAPIDASSVRSGKSRSASVNSQSSHGSRHDEEGISIVTQSVTTFVHSLQQPKYTTPLSGADISRLFQTFYKELEQTLYPTDESNVRLLSQDEMAARNRRRRYLKRLMDGAEQQLAGILYTKLFEPVTGPDRSIDTRLQARIVAIKSHQQLSDEIHADMPPEIKTKLAQTVETFSRIDRDRIPLAKLDILVQTHREIVAAIDAAHVNADILLPAFIYVLVEANVPHLWLNTVYMRRFRREAALEGEYNYCLTNLEAAVHLLNTWTFSELPPDVDASVFGDMPAQESGGRWRGPSLWNSSLGSTLSTGLSSGYSTLLSKFQKEHDITARDDTRPESSPSPAPHQRRKPAVHSKFLNLDADQLTIGEVRELLHEYRRLAAYIHR